MKKFILLTMVVFSLGALNEDAYGKPGNDKGRGKKERPEKGNSEGSLLLNQNEQENEEAVNWRQYKKNPNDYDLEVIFGDKYVPGKEYTEEEIKAALTHDNQRALDARLNWGQLKNEFRNDDGTYDLEGLKNFLGISEEVAEEELEKTIKEAIKAERVIRMELRGANVDEDDLEDAINDYLYVDELPEGVEETLAMERARDKYYGEWPSDE